MKGVPFWGILTFRKVMRKTKKNDHYMLKNKFENTFYTVIILRNEIFLVTLYPQIITKTSRYAYTFRSYKL